MVDFHCFSKQANFLARVVVQCASSFSETDMFDAYMVEALKHASEQADLSLIRRRKIRMTAFGAVRDIT